MFPNGFSEFVLDNKKGAHAEMDCMLHTKKFNYKAAILQNSVCDHIGGGRSTWS